MKENLEEDNPTTTISMKDQKRRRIEWETNSLIDCAIEGISLMDIDVTRTLNYVPDMYFLGCISHRVFELSNLVVETKRLLHCTAALNQLYIAYIAMYHVLRCVNETQGCNYKIKHILGQFEILGILRLPIPNVLKAWFDATGEYLRESRSERIKIHLPDIGTEGDAWKNYYWDEFTADHLPNFRCILLKMYFLSPYSEVPQKQRGFGNYRTGEVSHGYFTGLDIRSHDPKIPFAGVIIQGTDSQTTYYKLCRTLSREYKDPYSRYFCFDDTMITHCFDSISKLYELSATFTLTDVTSVGNESLLIAAAIIPRPPLPVIHEEEEDQVIPEEAIPAPQPTKRKKHTTRDIPPIDDSSLSHYKIISKEQIQNGFVLHASVLPTIRILSSDETIFEKNPEDVTYPTELFKNYLFESQRLVYSSTIGRLKLLR